MVLFYFIFLNSLEEDYTALHFVVKCTKNQVTQVHFPSTDYSDERKKGEKIMWCLNSFVFVSLILILILKLKMFGAKFKTKAPSKAVENAWMFLAEKVCYNFFFFFLQKFTTLTLFDIVGTMWEEELCFFTGALFPTWLFLKHIVWINEWTGCLIGTFYLFIYFFAP